MRLLFFGTPAFAVPTLERLLDSSHQVAAVVTQPDRPRGRGQRVAPGPVKTLALARGVPVLQPDRLVRETLEPELRGVDAVLGVVAAYGKILPDWASTGCSRSPASASSTCTRRSSRSTAAPRPCSGR